MLLSYIRKNKGSQLITTQKKYNLIYSVIFISLFFAACSNHRERVVVEEPKPVPIKIEIIEKKSDINTAVVIPLTPLQRCKTQENKFNLIVDAPVASTVRILNIKPKYRDCIALKKGKYHIEVYQYGYEKYKRWIILDSNKNLHVDLKKAFLQKKSLKVKQRAQRIKLEKAGYNSKKLQNFIKRYPNSLMAHTANKRINRIKKSFRNYSPHSLIKSNNCIGFYPKSLVDKTLKVPSTVNNWNSIRWSGSCKNELMFGRGVLYFDSDKGVHVELKGKMKNGFFEGRVYNSSNSKNKTAVKGNSNGYYTVKLKNRFDFKQYQD